MVIRKHVMACACLCAATMLVANLASAETISGVSTNSSSHIVFDSTGALGGVTYTTTGTYDGITFNVWTGTADTPQSLGGGVYVVASSNWSGIVALGGDEQYTKAAYTSGQEAGTYTFSGLDASQTYVFQFGFADKRHSYPYDVTATLLSDTMTATTALKFGDSTANDYALLTATVSGSTGFQLSLPVTTGGVGPICCSFSASVVSVPEPSTLALLAGGLLGLIAYAWRKRK
jgi:hypothetical protein